MWELSKLSPDLRLDLFLWELSKLSPDLFILLILSFDVC